MTSKNSFWVSLKENNKRRIWLWILSAFTYLVAKLNELKLKGVTIVMYPAAFEQDAFKGSTKSIEYISKRLRLAGFPYICNPRDCSFPKNDFYDTNYHLNHQGALLHNKHLIKTLKKIKY